MESINTLFLLTAGAMAAVGIVLFVIGLIIETPLKYVFLMIAVLGFAGKFLLPHNTYKQAKKEGIVWLTVLNNGNIEQARKDHQKGVQACKNFISADGAGINEKPVFVNENENYCEYKSNMYWLKIEPIKNFKCLQGSYNIIRVSIFDLESENYYYMHYLTGRDWNYTYKEFCSNKDLRPRREINLGVTNNTINWFASDVSSEVTATKDNVPEYYVQIEKTHFAYGWTENDRKRLINGMTDE